MCSYKVFSNTIHNSSLKKMWIFQILRIISNLSTLDSILFIRQQGPNNSLILSDKEICIVLKISKMSMTFLQYTWWPKNLTNEIGKKNAKYLVQSILLEMLCLSTVLCSLEKSMHPYGHIQEKSNIPSSSFRRNSILVY